MTTEYEHGFADGRDAQAQELKRLQAQVAALTDERDVAQGLLLATSAALDVMRETATKASKPSAILIAALAEANAKLAAIPWQDLRVVYRAAEGDGCANDNVLEWLYENGVKL